MVIFFPLFGGVFYLIFYMATSRATVFLHQDGEEVHAAGDLWLLRMQEARRDAFIAEQRQIKEQGFLAVMWPKLVTFLVMMFLWIWFLRWYF